MSDTTAPPAARRRHRAGSGARPRAPELLGGNWDGIVAAVAAAGIPLFVALNEGGLDPLFSQQAAIGLWWAIALAVAFGLLPRARPAPLIRLVLALLAALIGWTLLGLLWTESLERSNTEIARLVGYAGVVVVALLGLSRHTWRPAAGGLLAALLLIPLASLASRLAPEVFADAAVSVGEERLSYPIGYWNGLACWCAMALAAGLAWSAHVRSWQRPASLALAAVAGTTLFLTYSRGGLVAALIGVALVLALSARRRTAAIHGSALVAAVGAMAVVIDLQPEIADGTGTSGAAVVAVFMLGVASVCAFITQLTLRRDLKTAPDAGRASLAWVAGTLAVLVATAALVAGSVSGQPGAVGSAVERGSPATRLSDLEGPRPDLWRSALAAFQERPATGIGPGSFEFWWIRDVPGGERVRDAHSLYLETLGELGLVGLLLIAGFVAALVMALLRARRTLSRSADVGAAVAMLAAGAVFAAHAGVDWMWEVPAVSIVGLGALAIGAAAASRNRAGRARLRPGSLALVVAAVLAGLMQLPSAVAEHRVRTSEAYLLIGVEDRAAELADDAQRAQPWAASPYAQGAFVALADERYRDARADVELAIDREPTNWRHRYLQLWIAFQTRSADRAKAALEELLTLAPALEDQRAEFEAAITEMRDP